MRKTTMGRRNDADGGGPRHPRRAGRPRRSAAFIATAWVSGVLAAVLVAGALVGYIKYRQIWDGIRHEAISGLGHRPPKYTSALNLLLFGSDTRVGLTRRQQLLLHVGRSGCGCSDTIMVLHISPGRHRVTVLNLPRDTMVPSYGCPAVAGLPGEQTDTSAMVQINQTLALGGASCLWKTVEHLTGIHIDHFIQIQFNGVVRVIDDVGGVNVCVPQKINDPNSGLNISAGPHHIFGLRFLEFWRARETVADGSDLKRIARDDLLLAQVLRGIIHKGLLTSPTKLLPVVQDAAHAIYATDSGMTVSDLVHIAGSFRGLTSKDVQFIQALTQPYPPAPAHVELQSVDQQLFSAVARDKTLPKKAGKKATTGHAGAVLDTVKPADVQVQVLNGTTVPNLASDTAASLTARGFHVVGSPGNAPSATYTKSVIEFASNAQLPQARTLAAQIANATLRKVPGTAAGTVELILGSSFKPLGAQSSGPQSSGPQSSGPQSSGTPSSKPSVGSLAKSFGGITGTATCRSDASAFRP